MISHSHGRTVALLVIAVIAAALAIQSGTLGSSYERMIRTYEWFFRYQWDIFHWSMTVTIVAFLLGIFSGLSPKGQ